MIYSKTRLVRTRLKTHSRIIRIFSNNRLFILSCKFREINMLWTADPFCINNRTLTEILWASIIYSIKKSSRNYCTGFYDSTYFVVISIFSDKKCIRECRKPSRLQNKCRYLLEISNILPKQLLFENTNQSQIYIENR